MLSVYTPAKVNLFLNILGQRKDGFHEIRSVMQAIGLWDRLDVSPVLVLDEISQLQFTCNWPELNNDSDNNLVVRAYHLFWDATGLPPLPLHIHLEKGIPLQAGLGGGSSDAAATLIVLNHLSQAGLSDEELCTLGAMLGSDVPFFIRGGLALATGRGEILTPLEAVPVTWPLIIVKPRHLGSDTGLAYRLFAEENYYDSQNPTVLLQALTQEGKERQRNASSIFSWDAHLLNDFERVLFSHFPPFVETARKLRTIGVRQPLLCGSGAAMMGFIDASPIQLRDEIRPALLKAFPKERFEVFRTATWSGGLVQAQART
jgi:4-diphosphocytidyl-2-C-methyl-D-erythritol kinase